MPETDTDVMTFDEVHALTRLPPEPPPWPSWLIGVIIGLGLLLIISHLLGL